MARVSLASPDTSKQTRLRQVVPQGPDKKEIAVGRCFPPATAPQGRWVLTARTRETAESSGAVQIFFVPLAFAHDVANVQVIQKVNSGQAFLSPDVRFRTNLVRTEGDSPVSKRVQDAAEVLSPVGTVRCVSPLFPPAGNGELGLLRRSFNDRENATPGSASKRLQPSSNSRSRACFRHSSFRLRCSFRSVSLAHVRQASAISSSVFLCAGICLANRSHSSAYAQYCFESMTRIFHVYDLRSRRGNAR
ncbi:MAG: hypothetical protein QOG83_3394 [Alphaproteobacteria bacterium]|jgi:hypothetical protein|nr:hypothetical protein [Alphaproteobacteria bacterium]